MDLRVYYGALWVKSFKFWFKFTNRKLSNEAAGLIDVLAPPDVVVGSPFGASDGDIYRKYLN